MSSFSVAAATTTIARKPVGSPRHGRSQRSSTPERSGSGNIDGRSLLGSPGRQGSPRVSAGHVLPPERVSSGSTGPRLSRTSSLYTLSRTSFARQLSQLTTNQLPHATELSTRISALPTAAEAATALSTVAEQISSWTRKALDVLKQLDAEDDVEWAAAGASDGIHELEQSTIKFDKLVKIYVKAMEDMQSRSDVITLSDDSLNAHVSQLESVVKDWQAVKERLKAIKLQEQVAIEWQELANNVLGEVERGLESANELVFELEEQRHKRTIDDGVILEQSHDSITSALYPKGGARIDAPLSPTLSSAADDNLLGIADGTSLVALFARMQPVRASLDFLPIRLSKFQARGKAIFPTACDDLTRAHEALETQYRELESNSEAIRKELGEDRWILVFRNAEKKALKMFESIERSQCRLMDAVRRGLVQTDLATLSKMTEYYKAKKAHYVPAVEQLLAIIDQGLHERNTVNGEILRLQSDMKRRWTALQASMKTLDSLIEGHTSLSGQPLRDSVSSNISSELSYTSSNGDTMKTSPASSCVSQSRKGSFTNGVTTPTALPKSRLPRQSLLTPTTLPLRSNVAQLHSQRSVTSPSPQRKGVYARRASTGGRYRESLPTASNDVPPVPMLTPSPRKYSSSLRPAGDPASTGRRPRSSDGRLTAVNDTPISARRRTSQTSTPVTARRSGSIANASRCDGVDVHGRLYPPSVSRMPSRPSTSHGPRYSYTDSTYGRRSSLATAFGSERASRLYHDGQTGADRPVHKPRWHF